MTAPVLPCWYCEGRDPEGEPHDSRVHGGWNCEACDERRKLHAAMRLARGVLRAMDPDSLLSTEIEALAAIDEVLK